MYPHERSLVKRLESKPFALVGINSDPSREQLKKVIDKEKMTWRSFFDGSTSGPIASKWNVHGWPTLYVIDAKGVIRHKWVGSPGDEAMDKAIDKLVGEAAGRSKTPTERKEGQ
jgi:peroxiredoxin